MAGIGMERGSLAALAASVLIVVIAGAASPGRADDAPTGTEEQVAKNTEQIGVLAEEIDALRKIFAVPEEGGLQSKYGLGPAASKVYFRDRGLSIGGYGEVVFSGEVADKTPGSQSVFDALRAVLYTGYKFNDWIVMNSEIEFEHGSTEDGGAVSIEFLTLDFLLHDAANLRAGLLLVPMGFINEIHEPVYFFGVTRPAPERRIIPTTWRENGVGVFGGVGDWLSYRVYGVNGMDATGFDENGLRGGRQNGAEALADNFGFVGRVDFTPVQGLLFGGSVYTGKSGQNQTLPGGPVPDTLTTIWEVHAEGRAWGLSTRALWTEAKLDDTLALNTALGLTPGVDAGVARKMRGGYGEIAYDVLPLLFPNTGMAFEPFYRFEYVDTQAEVLAPYVRDETREELIHVVGVSFKPHPQVVIKLDYRNVHSKVLDLPDEARAGIGYVF